MPPTSSHLTKNLSPQDIMSLGAGIDVLISPVLLYGKNGGIKYANHAARQHWPVLITSLESGLDMESSVRAQLVSLVPNMPVEAQDAEVQRTLGLFHKSETDILYGAMGRCFRVEHHVCETGDIVGIGVDITEMMKHEAALDYARKEAEAANVAKSEFLANMSHEIRTPMNGILGMAQLMMQSERDKKDAEKVSIIHRSAESLLTIINDILDYSKIEAGELEFLSEPFSMQTCAQDVLAILNQVAVEKGVGLTLTYASDLPDKVLGDEGRVRQVLLNIIGNAVKFTEQGSVHIRISPADMAAPSDKIGMVIDVEDTGIGIPSNKIDKIFNKFSQADESTTRRFGGTGLGLSISKQLSILMGGNITVKSEVGQGSVFTITLEFGHVGNVTRQTINQPEDVTNVDIGSLSGTVMVVDDNPDYHAVISEHLKETACKIVHVNTARRAILLLEQARLHNINFDAIIIDYHMPVLSGEDLIRLIRQNDAYEDIALMLVSATHIPNSVIARVRGDVSYVLPKSCSPQILLNAVYTCLHREGRGKSSLKRVS